MTISAAWLFENKSLAAHTKPVLLNLKMAKPPLIITSGNSAAPAELPDVLFLDIFMPILDGWQFLERFAELSSVITKSPQIFILSSTLDVNDIERAEENPLVSGFIPKPVNLRQVERIIHKTQYYGLTA